MAVATTPTYPVIDEAITVLDAALAGDVQVIELTSVPSLSELAPGLLQLPSDTVQTSSQRVAELELTTADFTADVAGEYGVTVYSYREWPAGGIGDRRFEFVAKSTGTAHVGEVVTLPVATLAGDSATIELTVVDETVRVAELTEPTTERARVACLDATVVTELAGLVGVTVANLGAELQAAVNDLRDEYERHRVLVAGAVHQTAGDTTNTVTRTDSTSQADAIALLNTLSGAIAHHLADSETAAVQWHLNDDGKNVPLTGPARTIGEATVHCCDLRWRSFSRHMAQIATPTVHTIADGGALDVAQSPLDDVIIAFLDALAIVNPTAPTGEPEGAVDAVHRYGFTRAASTGA